MADKNNEYREAGSSEPAHQFDRRMLLRGAAVGLGVLAVGSAAGCGITTRKAITTVGQVDFANMLHIPPLAESMDHDGTKMFDLTLMAGKSKIVPQGETDTWGVNGALLGPTIRAKRGDAVHMNVTNTLPEATALHWHGMRLPASADGGPHQPINPGSTWMPMWTIDQPAATLWYHPHPHGVTESHLYRGISGFFLLDDDEEAALPLPRDYGVDDIPVLVQDRTYDETGALLETQRIDIGMLGDTIIVNGTAGPILEVSAEVTRLRLLNGSAARCYNFGFADDREFQVIASDGGLLSEPITTTRVMLSPAERVEILVTMKPGEEVVLRSFAQDLGLTSRLGKRNGADDEMDILLLRSAATLTPSAGPIGELAAIAPINAADAVQNRRFDLGNNRINNLAMDMTRIDATVKADTVEVWTVKNIHTRPHNFHIHDVQFQVLDVDGQPPAPELAGWKDTIYVPPGVTMRLAMTFASNPDADMPYMFHCHLLWHEDAGMMGQFLVVDDPANAVTSVPAAPHSHGN